MTPRRILALISALAFVLLAFAPPAGAIQAEALGAEVEALLEPESSLEGAVQAAAPISEGRLSTAVEIAVLLTVLSLLPGILITITSFTRIVIVLSFVRRALSVNELPPNPVIIGLALFLTTFVMAPVAKRVHAGAWEPYRAGEISFTEAGSAAWDDLSKFLVSNTRESELRLFAEMGGIDEQAEQGVDLPLHVIVPAFILSELKTAFQMGFLLFLPFLVIDMIVSSVLLSMGMFMLPPVMISTPFKILIFVLVDGWHLVCESVVTSFVIS